MDLDALGDEPFCYLTTTGRRTGRRRPIEIWFAVREGTVTSSPEAALEPTGSGTC
jgi:hypothetical protein